MARLDPGASARWLARRAKQTAASLKSEYEAGKRGDESPVEPIFPTPAEQLAALQRLVTRSPATGADDAGPGDAPTDDAETSDADAETSDADTEAEAAEVASALRRVDWQQVRAATTERTGEAADAMRTMARQVDWAKVQPVAAQVSSALIAAVASGRLPVGGRLGPLVLKALTDRGALASRVGATMQSSDDDLPPDFRAHLDDGRTPDPSPTAGDVPTAPLPRWRRSEP
jgi:hypothetical protein